jgi:ATP-dependent HslUV protease subunit HslV
MEKKTKIRSTTVLAVIQHGELAIGSDGQATLGNTIVKSNVKKIRKLELKNGNIVLSGFAGSTADAFTLLARFEDKLNNHPGNMKKAAVELAKEWRMDRYLRHLEAMIIAADKEEVLIISGNGDVLEPDNNIAAIGSGSMYARSAALALKRHAPNMSAKEIVREGLSIAADICIYTNNHCLIEELK